MSMRTPLGKVRGLGSAKEGTEHFWLQRLTAVANVPLILAFVIFLIVYNGEAHEVVAGAFSNPLIAVLFILIMVSGLVHMRLGMQTVIEDYVHSEGTKIVLLMLNTFFTITIGAASLFAIIKLGFGG